MEKDKRIELVLTANRRILFITVFDLARFSVCLSLAPLGEDAVEDDEEQLFNKDS